MVDMNKLLGQFLGNTASEFAGGMAGGLASSLLTSKSGRKLGKSALKLGGIAAVGALAYTAYQRYNSNQVATSAERANEASLTPAPQGSAFLPKQNDYPQSKRWDLF